MSNLQPDTKASQTKSKESAHRGQGSITSSTEAPHPQKPRSYDDHSAEAPQRQKNPNNLSELTAAFPKVPSNVNSFIYLTAFRKENDRSVSSEDLVPDKTLPEIWDHVSEDARKLAAGKLPEDPSTENSAPSSASTSAKLDIWHLTGCMNPPEDLKVDSTMIDSGDRIPPNMTLDQIKQNLRILLPQLQTLLRLVPKDCWTDVVEWFRLDRQQLSQAHLDAGFGGSIPFEYGKGHTPHPIRVREDEDERNRLP